MLVWGRVGAGLSEKGGGGYWGMGDGEDGELDDWWCMVCENGLVFEICVCSCFHMHLG